MYLQFTISLDTVQHHHWMSGEGEQRWHGLFNRNTVRNAVVCGHLDILLPLEDEPRSRIHHVWALRAVCYFFIVIRVSRYSVPFLVPQTEELGNNTAGELSAHFI